MLLSVVDFKVVAVVVYVGGVIVDAVLIAVDDGCGSVRLC